MQRERKDVCVRGGGGDDVKDNQEKERFLNVIQESGTSTQREGKPSITAGHTADLERNQFRMGEKSRVCGDRGRVSYEAQVQRNGGNLKIVHGVKTKAIQNIRKN